MTKLLVAGGRDLELTKAGYKVLDQLHKQHSFSLLINGGAKGIDKSALLWANYRGIEVQIFYPNWSIGLSAGPIRNQQMIDFLSKGDVAVFFAGGTGTLDCYGRAMKAINKGIDLHHYIPLKYLVRPKTIIQCSCSLCGNPSCCGLCCTEEDLSNCQYCDNFDCKGDQ